MNTEDIKNLISNTIFESIINVIDNTVVVNLDYFTNRNFQSQGINEFLYTLSGFKKHVLVFLIRDGVNCRLTGIREVVRKIITDLALTKETCYIYGYENLDLENTTFIEIDVLKMWGSLCFKKIKNLPPSTNQFQKKFAALFGRHDLYRLKFFRHLHEHFQEESLLAFNSTNGVYSARFTQEFIDDHDWYQTNCPVLLDFEVAQNWVSYEKSLDSIEKHYKNYFIEIVAETDFYSDKFFTEKTLKNLYLGKPFILWSGPFSLFTLQQKGFKTFAPFIDESYDKIKNTKDRFDAIISEINRIGKLSFNELAEIHNQLNDVLRFNRDIFIQKFA